MYTYIYFSFSVYFYLLRSLGGAWKYIVFYEKQYLFSCDMQKLGGNAMLVDAEHAFDPAYSKAVGVDVENLIVCQPDHGEMALESNIFSYDFTICLNENVMAFGYWDACDVCVLMDEYCFVSC